MTRRRFLVLLASIAAAAGCARGPEPTVSRFEPLAIDADAASAVVSAYRRAHGLPPVGADPVLQKIAQAQAAAMARAGTLSHTVAGPLSARLDAANLSQVAAVENVSAGYANFPAVFAGWRRSPAHDANLLDAPMRRLGIAAAVAPDTRYKTFWALVMTN